MARSYGPQPSAASDQIVLCTTDFFVSSVSLAIAWQHDGNRQTAADSVGGTHLSAECLDVASHHPETKAGMWLPLAVGTVGPRREVALEDALDLVVGNAR